MGAKPYVGVTGLVNKREVAAVRREFVDAGYSRKSQHIPMLGFLVSFKTLRGIEVPNRRYPAIRSLAELLVSPNDDFLPMIHYNSRERNTLIDQVTELFDGIYQSSLCRALQLNVVWPPLWHVRMIKRNFPEMNVVLQLSRGAMKGRSIGDIVREVGRYGKTIDYVLIDQSGGRGDEFDVGCPVAICRELRDRGLTVGFAGGLSGENVEAVLLEIIKMIHSDDFCIDAEGSLRDKRSQNCGDDDLNLDKVRGYVRATSKALRWPLEIS